MKDRASLRVLRFVVTIALVLFSAAAIWAQSTTDGGIGGTVTDPTGAAITGATVTVINNATGLEQTTTTNDTGYFRVAKLRPSSYTVKIQATGFALFTAKQVIVQIGTITEFPARLRLASAAVTVVVNGEVPSINTSSPDFSPIVDQTQVGNLPINGGRWSDFALLTPGVVNDANGFGLLSFRGVSTLLNNNSIDGADNNQAFFSEERGRTRAGYSSAKAVVNTVTKSGTNAIHGEVYFYDRDSEWEPPIRSPRSQSHMRTVRSLRLPTNRQTSARRTVSVSGATDQKQAVLVFRVRPLRPQFSRNRCGRHSQGFLRQPAGRLHCGPWGEPYLYGRRHVTVSASRWQDQQHQVLPVHDVQRLEHRHGHNRGAYAPFQPGAGRPWHRGSVDSGRPFVLYSPKFLIAVH